MQSQEVMRNNRCLNLNKIIPIIFLWGFLFSPSFVAADENSGLIAQYLMRRGISYYERGDYISAIHEFNKAMLADPGNILAQDYLNKLGISSAYYGRPGEQPSPIQELTTTVQQYKKEVRSLKQDNQQKDKEAESLRKERDRLKQSTIQYKSEKDSLTELLGNTQQQADDQSGKDKAVIQDLRKASREKEQKIAHLSSDLDKSEKVLNILQNSIVQMTQENKTLHTTIVETQNQSRKDQAKIKEINQLNSDLASIKDTLAEKLVLIQNKENQIKDLEKNLNSNERHWRENKISYEKQIHDLEQKFNEYKLGNNRSIDSYNNQAKELQDLLAEKKKELGAMQDRVTFAEYKLSQHDAEVAEKDKRITELKNGLSGLEKELVSLQGQLKEKGGAAQVAQNEQGTQEDMDRIKLVKRQDRLISDLKEKLLSVRQQMDTMKQPNAEENANYSQDMIDLKEQLGALNSRLEHQETALKEKTEGYSMLESRLQDTQERLDVVDGIMQKKNDQIKELEDQLTQIMSQYGGEFSDLKKGKN